MIPNTPPDGQVGVIPGTVDVAGVAIAQLLGRDAIVVRFPASSGWSVQAFLDQRASLDTSALVRGKVVSESESFRNERCRSTELAPRCRAIDLLLLSQVLCRWQRTSTLRHNVTGRCRWASRLYFVRWICHCKLVQSFPLISIE